MANIILASASPRRQQLLQQAEIEFDIITADIDESYPDDIPIREVPEYIARQKLNAVCNSTNTADKTVIAADTIVLLENTIIGKPTNEEEAIQTLSRISGKIHHVITGVSIRTYQSKVLSFSDTTEVEFNTLTKLQIQHYVQHYHPFDKAGAYAIQEWIGVIGIKAIRGCFYNVMGLPVSKVLAHLQ